VPDREDEFLGNPYQSPRSTSFSSVVRKFRLPLSFWIWFTIVGSVLIMLNLPRNTGPLSMLPETAGFPWQFACWDYFSGKLLGFETCYLIMDIALGLVISVLVGLACSLSRK
jgi:hypothetical protein